MQRARDRKSQSLYACTENTLRSKQWCSEYYYDDKEVISRNFAHVDALGGHTHSKVTSMDGLED